MELNEDLFFCSDWCTNLAAQFSLRNIQFLHTNSYPAAAHKQKNNNLRTEQHSTKLYYQQVADPHLTLDLSVFGKSTKY